MNCFDIKCQNIGIYKALFWKFGKQLQVKTVHSIAVSLWKEHLFSYHIFILAKIIFLVFLCPHLELCFINWKCNTCMLIFWQQFVILSFSLYHVHLLVTLKCCVLFPKLFEYCLMVLIEIPKQ